MNSKSLLGITPEGKIRTVDGERNIVDPNLVIFPILKQTSVGDFHLIGTGFFISTAGIFVTAKHVLLDVIGPKGEQICPILLVQFLGTGYLMRPIVRFTIHEVADIAVGIAAPTNHNSSGLPLQNKLLQLTQNIPAVGQKVCTYAYPRSVMKHGKEQELHFNTDFFDGVIQEHYLTGRDSVLLPGPCIQTNMYIHGGASGGPVFDASGKVFAVNSTGYTNDDLSFVTPINTIENLLLSDIIIPSNNTGQVRIRELIDSSLISYE
jgi:Trypsin-like peptidase domain